MSVAEFHQPNGFEPGLRLAGIKKQFGNAGVLRGLDLFVEQGEFITLLGSSGCGKTTTIRIIAGLETADSGQVFIDGIDVSFLPPDKRRVNMVFQNYALFPHMNVEQNTGYSLKLMQLSKNEINKAVSEALELVKLSGFEKRKPDELSGGEKQRVALARAIINKPKVLLLDEPLGALDLQLRRRMQVELKRLQRQLGITFIYITHDQEEALSMSDRIAVMRNGIFEQTGSAAEIYNSPKTAYVAGFVGGANVIRGRVCSVAEKENGKTNVCFEHTSGKANIELCANKKNFYSGSEILIAVREEHIIFRQYDSADSQALCATITGKSFSGGLLRISARLCADGKEGQDLEINSCVHGIESSMEPGEKVCVTWNASNAILLES